MRAPAIAIERMTVADVPAVAGIDEDARVTAAQIAEELSRPFARLWMAKDAGGRAAAFLVAWHVADELHVLNVATARAQRRRGFGRALVNESIAYAREHRLKHVLLEVRRSNRPAIALYRSVGFFAMGVRARYYPDDEDAVEMVLMLDPESGAVVAHADEVRLD